MKFKTLKANEYCDSVRDGTHDSPKKVEKGYKLITSKNIKEYGLDLQNASNISKKDYDKVNERSLVEKNDILYSMIGTIGLIHRVNYEPNYAIKNIGLFKIKDEQKSKWLYYYLKTPKMKNYINSLLAGSTQQYITLNNLRELPIQIPEITSDTNKIIYILDLIETKITNNTHTNNNLLEFGDLIFNNFFNLSSIKWDVKTLKEISTNFDFKRKPLSSREREEHKGIYPYYGAASIIDYVDDYLFDDTYILMGEDGTVITADNKPVLQYIWGKFWTNNHAHVLQGKNVSNEYLYFALRNTNVKSLVTGAVQPKINQENMNKLKFIIPDQDNLKILEENLSVLMKKYKNNCYKISKLEQIRDTLLPKLMNGEIDLNKVEI